MRLVCPNCEAKYEVPEDAIPDTGRDVQCTNCGHTWYQMRGRSGAAMPLTEALAETVAAGSDVAPATAEVGPAEVDASADDPATGEAVAQTDAAEVMPEDEAAVEPVGDLPEGPEAGASEPELPEQPTSEAETAADPQPDAPADQPAEPVPEPLGDPEPVMDAGAQASPEPETEAASAPEAMAGTPEAEAEGEAASDQGPEPAAAAYAVDDSVLAILREEAEREANARRAEALESQTDLGIEAAVPGKAAASAVEAEAKPSARRDLLPDVEEINSTLRPSEAALGDNATPDFVSPPPPAPRGFRSGFLSLMTVAILAAAIYISAPRLGQLVPALAGPLGSYVSLVDGMRLGLDGMMRSATVAISGN